jgi:hypothetical protein
VDEFRSQDFGLLNWEAPGIDFVYSILFQNGTLIRPASTRFVIGLQSHARGIDGAGRSLEEAGSGHEDSSHNIPTLDALQVLSRSQVTPELSMSMRIPICKSLHTYKYKKAGDVDGACTHETGSRHPQIHHVNSADFGARPPEDAVDNLSANCCIELQVTG